MSKWHNLINIQALTIWWKSQLSAYNWSICIIPHIITHCPPSSINTNFHSSYPCYWSTTKANFSIIAMNCIIIVKSTYNFLQCMVSTLCLLSQVTPASSKWAQFSVPNAFRLQPSSDSSSPEQNKLAKSIGPLPLPKYALRRAMEPEFW